MDEFISTLIIIIIVLILAKLFGELFEKFGQSAVLGELTVGLILGPSLFNILIPSENIVFSFLAEIGVILLLFEVGLQSNLYKMLKVGFPSLMVAIIGVILPVTFGYIYFAIGGYASSIAIFVGATLAATSVGITMRVLSDIKKLNTQEGKIILGAAVIDDVLGLIILSMITSFVELQKVSFFALGKITFLSILFLVITTWVGIKYAPWFFKKIAKMEVKGSIIAFAFALSLILAVAANYVGLATVIGAFAAGLILERTEQKKHISIKIQPVCELFVPLFFVAAGAYMDIKVFSDTSKILIVLSLLAIAIVGKVLAGFGAIGTKANKLAIGIGMIPRGEVGLIFATYGLKTGIVGTYLYSVLAAVIILTTFITPPLLEPIMKRIKN